MVGCKAINQTKKNLMNQDPSSEKEYAPYIINRCLSGHIDCVMYANEMNIHNQVDKDIDNSSVIGGLYSEIAIFVQKL